MLIDTFRGENVPNTFRVENVSNTFRVENDPIAENVRVREHECRVEIKGNRVSLTSRGAACADTGGDPVKACVDGYRYTQDSRRKLKLCKCATGIRL